MSLAATFQVGDELVRSQPATVTISLGIVPQASITATATSSQPGFLPSNALDGNPSTFWHTEYSPTKPPLPQSITLDLGAQYSVSGVAYLPRQDAQTNGRITTYVVYGSADGSSFQRISGGQWAADAALKKATFAGTKVRYLKVEATAAVNDFVSAAELTVFGGPA